MECIMVIERDGVYQIHPNTAPVLWDDVQALAESVERIEGLLGWGRWTAAYRVQWAGREQVYFVQEAVR
jgi:hypothetical protein